MVHYQTGKKAHMMIFDRVPKWSVEKKSHMEEDNRWR